MTDPGQIFDRALHRRRLDRAAGRPGEADFLRPRVAADLVERLGSINRRFPIAVDLGSRHGDFRRALAGPEAEGKIDFLIETDLSERMLRRRPGPRLVADEERPPFAPASVDLVVSTLALHWVGDLVGSLIQLRRALKPDGLLLVSLLGGATLTELRAALLEAEIAISGGAGPRISPFLDAFDAAGLLQRAGFALPVVDTDRLTVRYDHPMRLLADLRALGETNVLADRPASPLSRAVLRKMSEIYVNRFGGQEGKAAATFEVVTLTGWAPHPDQQRPLAPGSANTSLAAALATVSRGAGSGTPTG